jgi:RNA polymerase sigma-70 factor, ECF subfamily
MASITHTLWQAAKGGDQSAYDRLFALHRERALLFIRARLGPTLRATVDANDILQDAYLALHKTFQTFEYTDDGSFLRLLCRIIENRIRDWNDYVHAAKRQPVVLPTSDQTGPSTALDRQLDRERLLAAMDELPADYREVLLLRYFEGLNSEEAAIKMERSAGAVRKLTSRALEELGQRLKQNGRPVTKEEPHL